MNLAQRAEQVLDQQYDVLRIVDGWYEVEEDGYRRPMPVLHFHGRTTDGEYRHFAVDDYRPYFYVPDTIDRGLLEDLDTDRRVLELIEGERRGIYDDGLVRVVVECPWHVKQLREPLHDEDVQTYEADVRFVQRFLIDSGLPLDDSDPIRDYCRVPARETEVSAHDVESVDADSVEEVEPRVCTLDIEVATNETQFPEPKDAQQPITAVTVHDSYVGDYWTLVLDASTDAWDAVTPTDLYESATEMLGQPVGVLVFEEERQLLAMLVHYLKQRRFGAMTGWNADSFDAPYIVNRCLDEGVLQIEDISPTRNVERHESGGRFINGDISGIHIFDLLAAYEKSQYSELKSTSLEYVASKELDGMEKLNVDEQEAWVRSPTDFVAYVSRDVQATVRINESINLL